MGLYLKIMELFIMYIIVPSLATIILWSMVGFCRAVYQDIKNK